MKRPAKRAPVSVDRRHVVSRTAERVAALAIIILMGGLFWLMPGRTSQAGEALPFAALDLRELAPAPDMSERTGRVTDNVTATDALEVLGATAADAAAATAALRETSPIGRKRLRPGTLLTAFFETGEAGGAGRLIAVSIKPDAKTTVLATRRDDGSFMANVLLARTSLQHLRIAGEITTTLAEAIVAAGGTEAHADTFAGLFAEDEVLGRGGRPGERFDVVVEYLADERGNFLEAGDLVFAAFNGERASGSWYKFTPEDTGLAEFYTRNGVAGDEFISREPVRGSEISSGFGSRVHPITGEFIPHTGVDFRAPKGTPIRAAGAGLITAMQYGEGYGWFIRIRHERGFETVYAHMSGFVDGLTPGRAVMRGDTIGYVGDTGSTTGSHLHFEILRNGSYVNPMTLALPTGRDLGRDPGIFAAFIAERDRIDTLRGATPAGEARLVAARSTPLLTRSSPSP